MDGTCNVCAAPLDDPVYESAENSSITTMNKVIAGKTRVHFCDACGHLQTSELPDLARYYAQEYEINLASEDDDQLYKVVDGRSVYRADHQAQTALAKLGLRGGERILDYGCAKAPTLRRIVSRVPGTIPMTFDLTDKYVRFWQTFVASGDWAVSTANPDWNGHVDVVLSFYALEHMANPGAAVAAIRALLKPGGTFYFIVPNTYANIADFVVADHINHFSVPSIERLMAGSGFDAVTVDDNAHDAAFVVTARKADGAGIGEADPQVLAKLRQRCIEMGRFWRDAAQGVQAFESALAPTARAAIYGAGFYGNFVAATLREPSRIACFVDQNKHLQGRIVQGRPVVAPADLPEDIDALYVGLNPRSAREIIAGIDAWRDRRLQAYFL